MLDDGNRMAVHTAKMFAQSTDGDFIYIYGDYGVGKTHLLHAVKNEILKTKPNLDMICISAVEFLEQYIHHICEGTQREYINQFKNADILLLDDLQYLREKTASSEEVFYITDRLIQNGKKILIAGDLNPDSSEWNTHLKRLFAQLKPDHAVRIIREHKEKT